MRDLLVVAAIIIGGLCIGCGASGGDPVKEVLIPTGQLLSIVLQEGVSLLHGLTEV